jgi:hypothetical protein
MHSLTRTARATGAWYLGLAITGAAGHLFIRSALFVEGDPAATAAKLAERSSLAHLGLLMELLIVVTQAAAAVGFYRLFRDINASAAGALRAFGLVNSVAIMASAVFLATASAVVADPTLAPAGDVGATAQLLYVLSGHAWGVGALFFGLWLIPMGSIVATSRRMPRPLGWILVAGGVGYVASALLDYGWADAPQALVGALPFFATVGEVWMIGYLLSVGIRRPAVAAPVAVSPARAVVEA